MYSKQVIQEDLFEFWKRFDYAKELLVRGYVLPPGATKFYSEESYGHISFYYGCT